jgi:hypothetical protein
VQATVSVSANEGVDRGAVRVGEGASGRVGESNEGTGELTAQAGANKGAGESNAQAGANEGVGESNASTGHHKRGCG